MGIQDELKVDKAATPCTKLYLERLKRIEDAVSVMLISIVNI
jgi:hypothetical protein